MKPGKNAPSSKIRLRKHLNADALVRAVRREFEKIPDARKGRPQISFADASMSAFAMFSLKDPSLPAFEKRWSARDHNLHAPYHIEKADEATAEGRAVEFRHAAVDNCDTLHYYLLVNDLPP
ncbi:hypothetical protein [Desulfoglaeba alkanexedens]|uniref:Transposase n=1 Tax=Desulfoglaeba alkanexedens ALDC TaxID=980445 RepID=A0A4P8L511_9BACT|nr:hypothetical protein [Desulfoglaeba alkanexedens]QCQ23039.1 hypothetical protein FDQ92_13185 [Desulfoglaeba alkanexedens ALDC]